MTLTVKPFCVEVRGFPVSSYVAGSRGKALSRAWGDYVAAGFEVSFKDFLRITKAYGGVGHENFGKLIEVAGLPAYFVGESGQYVRFVRPDSDEILLSHPLDVKDRLL